MATQSESPMPYTAAAAVINMLRRYRDKGLTLPITPDVLVRAGVSESLVPRTMQSLQQLQLIDDAGNPTQTMKKMKVVPEADYKATLAEWLRSVYAEVFSFVDPATDDALRIRDAFRTYTPHGQQTRMVALFLALCAEAGITAATKKNEARPSARKPTTAAPRQAAPKPTPANTPRNASAHAVVPSAGLPPALSGLLQSIPVAGGWSQESRDRFMTVFGSVLDFAVPIRPDPEPVVDDRFGD